MSLRSTLFVSAILVSPPWVGALHVEASDRETRRVHVAAADLDIAALAKAAANGEPLAIDGLALEAGRSASTLELERFHVWRGDATVLIDERRVAVPRTVYLRGAVAGETGSTAFFSVRDGGAVQGIVSTGDGLWLVGKDAGELALRSRRADPSSARSRFECGADRLSPRGPRLRSLAGGFDPPPSTLLDQRLTATIAIETDYEYFALFGDPAAALDYIGDLLGYAGVVYSREIDTDLAIGFARLWTNGEDADPWTVTDSSFDALTQLRDYWNANMRHVPRATTHMLLGKSLGGGIAWIGTLCGNYQSPGSSFDYGLSSGIGGEFSWSGVENHDPAAFAWDIFFVLHELGHNFNSPHTQAYCNIGGNPLPIDRCAAGCAGAATGLPSCSSPPMAFDGGVGTIMSYCFGSISLTLGKDHTCGIQPNRVPDRIAAFVGTMAGAVPGCLQCVSEVESCDGRDNDCDGLVDEDYTFQRDEDGDSYGSPGNTTRSCSGIPPAGYVSDGRDCDDENPAIHPGAPDSICNGIDDDCDGMADEGFVPESGVCGAGACSETRTTSCVGGVLVDPCKEEGRTPGPG